VTWQNVLTNPTRAIMIDELLAPRPLRLPFFLSMAVGLGLIAWLILAYRSHRGWSRGRMATVGVVGGVLLLGGAGAAFRQPMASGDAGPILGTLLTNMYRAFDYREEESTWKCAVAWSWPTRAAPAPR